MRSSHYLNISVCVILDKISNIHVANFRFNAINVVSTTPDNIFSTWVASSLSAHVAMVLLLAPCITAPVTSYDFPTTCNILTL